MKKLLLFLFFTTVSFAQSIYKGNISEDGMGLPGATICVINTLKCTTSDFDGNYFIEAGIGDHLEISYVGMEKKIIKITNRSLLKNDERVTQILSNDYIQNLKKADDSLIVSKPSGKFNFALKSAKFRDDDIMKISRNKNGFYNMKSRNEYNKLFFEVHQEFNVSTPFRLPKYQTTYAQGRNINGGLVYQSPETDEIFSWGPNVNSLQYSQNFSEYYPQGTIVNRSSFGASSLQLYDPNHFYQNTIDSKTGFSAQIISPKGNFLKVNLSYKTGNVAIPETKNNEIVTSLKYFRNVSKYSKIETLLAYNNFDNNFSNSNFGINKVIFANSVTPIHFDTKWASTLENGSQRSYSQFENNPYYLIANNQDTNKSETTSFSFKHIYSMSKNFNTINAGFQSSIISNSSGQHFYFAGNIPNFNNRIEKFKTFTVSDVYKRSIRNGGFVESKIDFRFQERNLERNYFSGFNTAEDFPNQNAFESKLDVSQNRFEVFSTVTGSYNFRDIFSYYDEIVLKAISNFNYSSTVRNYILPGSFVSAEFKEFFHEHLTFVFSHSYTETEPSLQNNNLNFNSLRYNVNQFKLLKNDLELFTPRKAVAISENNANLNVTYRSSYYWNVNLSGYFKKVMNLYTPVFNLNTVNWSPDVNYKQNGFEFSVDKLSSGYRRLGYGFNFNFTYYRNEVTSLNNNQSRIPFAGFADVNKNYIVGQPLGVIVGNSYLRDQNQNMIIDSDGFPIKDVQPKIIGNPNPDFVVGFLNSFDYKRFTLQLSFDWSQGGEIWNGTQQTLNYYGKSALTEKDRNITNYVFPGVTASGALNTKVVSFYDVNLPIEQNLWTRYGIDGVAENAVEDATYFRFNSINLSYLNDFYEYNNNKLSFKIALFVNNIFIITKNRTAFSNNAMFNSIDSSGLDYFNSPLMRSFGSSLTIKF
ncbi:hypothetical protein B4N84_11220 [Flavobacterium sp. IR1]|nr:hypothetical protein B4N84_11220 [Flavobacterium sp. IR1]